MTEAIHFGNDHHPSVATLRLLDAFRRIGGCFASESLSGFVGIRRTALNLNAGWTVPNIWDGTDCNETQLEILRKRFNKAGYYPWIILDFIHVAEPVWKASLDFHGEGTKDLEAWVSKRLLAILKGRTAHVAAGMRRGATLRGLDEEARQRVDSCAAYLLKYKLHMRYDWYLELGLPIATGVIEGACRYLAQDRMDRTGARWTLAGAEAVLRLRSLRASGDFDAYWHSHEQQEYRRNHAAQYAEEQVPPIRSRAKRHFKRVK